MLSGNLNGIKKEIIDRLEEIESFRIDRKEFISEELLREIAELTGLTGREIAVYIARSLRVQNTARGVSPTTAEPVEVGDFAERYFTGTKTLKINERAEMPTTAILK